MTKPPPHSQIKALEVLSPNNRHLAGLNQEGGSQVRDLATGKPISASMRHEGPIKILRREAEAELKKPAGNAKR